ncbi:TPM domain-containing protein [Acinetobacter puyangensis]|uniref:TPM domain-containing protein n=1 Tax=Acinetobacter puyangensis TaxID=1096779 RepID=UPI003A4D952F
MQQIVRGLLGFVLCFSLLCISGFGASAFAETATATASDDSAEAVVLNKIINNQKQNAQQQSAQNAASQNSTAQSSVSADGTDENIIQRDIPQLNQPIIDQANILTAEQNQSLSQYIRQIYDSGQAQIGMVIVPSTGQEDIFSYSMRIAEKWQLGSAKHDNGLLIVVAVNDRRIQILTGYGLEGVLPDIMTHRIIQNQITPYFKQGQYAQGLQSGLEEINRILSQDPDVARQAAESLKEQQAAAHQKQQGMQNALGISIVILVIAVVLSALIGRKISALGAGVAGTALGMLSGLGLGMSLLLGGGLFFLVISSLAQLLFQAFASSGGGRGGGGGFGGGGGYSGGGGGFGGGGASGSW